MFPQKIRVCELFGIPVFLDVSTLFLLFFFVGMTDSLLLDVVCAALLLVSIVAHELGHSLTARTFGYGTRDITLSVIGGCASLTGIPRKAWQEFLTAVAGPLVSFMVAVVAFFASSFCPMPFLAAALYVTAIINFSLGAFNLLPGFPMDGGRIFRSVARLFTTRARATYVAMIVGRVAAALLILGPFLGVTHIWIIPIGGHFLMRLLIAWMIWREGWREYQQALVEEQWGGRWDWSARVSPPPYGGDEDDVEVRRHR